MPGEGAKIPGSQRAIDGFSITPGRELAIQINWDVLKREFFLDDEYRSVLQWLVNEKMWTIAKAKNGNTLQHTSGWGNEKARFQQQKTEYLMKAMIEEQRKRLPKLLEAKLLIVANIIQDLGSWRGLDAKEKKLCYEILKTELGEPTSIKTVGLVVPKDPVEALLEEYGMMENGRIIIDGDEQPTSSGDSEAIATVDSGPLAEIPQDPIL